MSGDVAGAKLTSAGIRDANARESGATAIAEYQAKEGNLGEVRLWVESLSDPGERASACMGAAKGLLPDDKGLWASAPAGAPPATQKAQRSAGQIMGDIVAIWSPFEKSLGCDPLDALLDPRKRADAGTASVPVLRKTLALIDEARQTVKEPGMTEAGAAIRAGLLASLAFLGDADALSQIDRAAQSQDQVEALIGKVAQALATWLRAYGDVPEEGKALGQLRDLVRSHPTNGMFVPVIEELVGHGRTSRELIGRAEDIALADLKCESAAELKDRCLRFRRWRAMEGKPQVIEGANLQGKVFSTAAWKGKVVLVAILSEFPAYSPDRWLPQMRTVYAEHHQRGLEILAMARSDQAGQLRTMARTNPELPWPQVLDRKGNLSLLRDYDEWNVPRLGLVVIDRKGIVRSVDAEKNLERLLGELLGERND
jgi:hypothetical protein